jgi:outer membrane receptor for ferric coprogen and ferric-rhodotorulic acid
MQSEDSNFTPALDTFLLDSIEIMRGPAGLLEGAGQPGGVVSRILKRPMDQFGIGGSVSYGSNQFKRSEFEIGGPLVDDGSLRARMASAVTDRNFFYDTADQRKFALLGTVEADII